MVILDTNHFAELDRATAAGLRLIDKLDQYEGPKFLTIITAEESTRGWLARIQPARDRAINAYARFQRCLKLIAEWNILPWTESSADIFDDLIFQRIRIGTLDLRIASIALVYDATLLTRNVAHFQQVPGLKIENWLD